MPKRLCLVPSCRNEATLLGRCAWHSKQHRKATASPNAVIYNSKRWQILRRRKLSLDPLCEVPDCGLIATDVHHKQDIAAGGEIWRLENLESLCHSCHSRVTGRQHHRAS